MSDDAPEIVERHFPCAEIPASTVAQLMRIISQAPIAYTVSAPALQALHGLRPVEEGAQDTIDALRVQVAVLEAKVEGQAGGPSNPA